MLIRRKFISLSIVLAGSTLLSVISPAQRVTTDPVGFTTTSSLSNSDTLVSIPFTRPPEFTGAIQSVAGSIITIAGTPGWTANQFVYAAGTQIKTYYVLIGAGGASNPKEGHTYFVSANGSNTLTVDTSTDTLTGITANTQLILIPYWTPSAIFPATDANVSFTPTTSSSSYKTQLLVPNNAALGINLPYAASYFFSNNVDGTSGNVGWRIVGNNTTDHGNDPLLPNSYFVIRNLNGAPTLPLKGIGGVLTKKLATALRTSATQAQDNAVSMVRPVDVTLNQSGLGPADGSFVATPPMREIRGPRGALLDQLLLFDNSAAAYDKQPSAIYYYSAGPGKLAGWKLVGDGSADHGDDLIPAGSAIVIRKAKSVGGQTVFWTNAPTY